MLVAAEIAFADICGMTNARTKKPTKSPVPAGVVTNESQLLRAIWEQEEREPQEVFAARHNIGSQSMMAQYLNGKRPLNLQAAIAFSRGLGVKIGDFSPRIAAMVREAIPHTENVQPVTLSATAAYILEALGDMDEIGRARLEGFAASLRKEAHTDADIERKMPGTLRKPSPPASAE